jgi:endonuclease/exonuclease/phosphatase family metal-dependent hydrolase
VRVLSWNLFHGRALPALDRDLLEPFSSLLASWQWDVALLQEVPPWWPSRLAAAAGAWQCTALTSRNAALPLRRALAERRPELMKSNGGGSNAVLAREPLTTARHVRLRRRPERRVAQLVRLQRGVCVANYHASTRPALAREELARLWELALEWAGPAPLILGGDLNLRDPRAAGGAVQLGARDVDHVFTRGMHAVGEARELDRHVELDRATVELSDHPPLLVQCAGQ